MNLAKTISELRKKNGLTQEQVAVKLNISAAAVSKWETGNSAPDINLLAPLARLFKVTVDQLLSFEMDLSDIQIKEIKQELTTRFMGGENAYQSCRQVLQEYPTNDMLKIVIGGLLQMYSPMENGMTEDLYEERINEALSLYEQAENAKEEHIADQARYMSSLILMEKDEYAEAEEKLKKIHQTGFDVTLQFIILGLKQNKWEETEILCSHQLLMKVAEVTSLLSQMSTIQRERHDFDKEYFLLNTVNELEKIFNTGLGASEYGLARYWLRQGNKEKAASSFKNYCDRVLTYPYDHHANPYFNTVMLQVDEAGQKFMRMKMIDEIINNKEWDDLKGNGVYEEANKQLKEKISLD